MQQEKRTGAAYDAFVPRICLHWYEEKDKKKSRVGEEKESSYLLCSFFGVIFVFWCRFSKHPKARTEPYIFPIPGAVLFMVRGDREE